MKRDRSQSISEEEINSSDSISEEEINVEFEYFNPREGDYHAIKKYLIQLFGPKEELYLEELTELIIKQTLLGTTIKIDGIDSDPYSITSVINMHHHSNTKCIQSLTKFILNQCKSPQQQSTFQSILPSSQKTKGKDTALLISERMINSILKY